jgi:hypothetical protein
VDGLRFVIYNKAGVFQRELSGVDASADLVPNAIKTASFTIDDDHPALPAITAKGARCGVWFRGAERLRGRIGSTPGDGPDGQVTANIESDHRKLWDWHGRQVPGAALDAQTSEYRVYTGPAETVVKNALTENFTRLGVPWTVAPTLGRGAASRAEFRMHPLADKLIPILDTAGLILTLAYDGGNVVVDVRQPITVPGVLTLETGIPDAYGFDITAPTVTRVVVGGRGEGVEREYVQVIDPARESDWGDIIEGFTDARNTEEGADLTIDGHATLAEGAARVSVSTDLVETDRFRYGTTYTEGDLVHVRVGPVDVTQRVSVAITETADNGVVVTPRIGEVEDSQDVEVQLAAQIERLARGIRDQGRR